MATNYFYYTAKPHLLNPIHYARIWNERRVYARIRRDFPELLNVIRTMTPAGSTGCGFSDYWELYSWVRRNAPLWVLECGGGVSSGVIATALAQNQRGRLISLDESRSYLDRAAALLPAHLRPWVEFRHSELGFQRYACPAFSTVTSLNIRTNSCSSMVRPGLRGARRLKSHSTATSLTSSFRHLSDGSLP
jgi:hypothetical protein